MPSREHLVVPDRDAKKSQDPARVQMCVVNSHQGDSSRYYFDLLGVNPSHAAYYYSFN